MSMEVGCIVVGAGSAGCVPVNRLSGNPGNCVVDGGLFHD
jgi:choline dehydrogenase-like flavoprotein